ncbi:MAG: mRNA interferase MazF [Alphaproteobacteria bacterium]|jgi:mRNA interferase MazF|nr:mRNA interferase MazF [Alphaproteobacteria bacterium]
MVKRGEVWLARLDPTEGREIQKTRPCLIVSPAEIHDFLDTVIVAPMTTKSRPARYRIETIFDGKENRILLEQLRALDKIRLLRSLGVVDRRTCSAVFATLSEMFAE